VPAQSSKSVKKVLRLKQATGSASGNSIAPKISALLRRLI
jgi:hypothetical protein